MSDNVLNASDYNSESIEHLEWNEAIRKRPGMYIGNTGDGSFPDDGIYILVKEVLDNAVDEFAAGFGKIVEIQIEDTTVRIRDYGRGIPPGKLIQAASEMHTGGKFNTKNYKVSVGLNGVGLKAVNATSDYFHVETFQNGHSTWAEFSAGNLTDRGETDNKEKNGTLVVFHADDSIFTGYKYNLDFITNMVKNYSYLHAGLTLRLNGTDYISKNGLLDLVKDNLSEEPLYEPIHLMGDGIEMVITHGDINGEDIASFVNGQNTTRGGTHLAAFREGVAKTLKDFYKKDYDPSDVRESLIGAVSIQVMEPIFGDQTKTKLNSKDVNKDEGPSVRSFVCDFIQEQLDNYLHKNPETAGIIQKRIQESEKKRKAKTAIDKGTKEKLKKASLCNKKLRDCHVHLTDIKNPLCDASSLFITEGDSASGSITKIRNVKTQAVFSLRGKVLNAIKKSDELAKNEELVMLRAALDIDRDIDDLRYNKVIIATDADNDGLHIRLLLMTFFLKLYPDLIRTGHLYILQTPLFRVRDKKQTIYCYNIDEKMKAIEALGKDQEITRFKGLGEISQDEFREFIGENMRLDKVRISPEDNINTLLDFYMGQNTPDRQFFIRQNLRSDLDSIEVDLDRL